jgi:uncharacterized protein (DUF1778 family)
MNLRIAEDVDAKIRRAAGVTGVSASAFVAQAAGAAADEVLADRRVFQLDPQRWDEFVALLDRPARDLPKLREARRLREPPTES